MLEEICRSCYKAKKCHEEATECMDELTREQIIRAYNALDLGVEIDKAYLNPDNITIVSKRGFIYPEIPIKDWQYEFIKDGIKLWRD